MALGASACTIIFISFLSPVSFHHPPSGAASYHYTVWSSTVWLVFLDGERLISSTVSQGSVSSSEPSSLVVDANDDVQSPSGVSSGCLPSQLPFPWCTMARVRASVKVAVFRSVERMTEWQQQKGSREEKAF